MDELLEMFDGNQELLSKNVDNLAKLKYDDLINLAHAVKGERQLLGLVISAILTRAEEFNNK